MKILFFVTNYDLYKSLNKCSPQYLALAKNNSWYQPMIAIKWFVLTYYSYQITKLQSDNCIHKIDTYHLNLEYKTKQFTEAIYHGYRQVLNKSKW